MDKYEVCPNWNICLLVQFLFLALCVYKYAGLGDRGVGGGRAK